MRRSVGAFVLAVVVHGCADAPPVNYRLVGSQAGTLPVRLPTDDGCYHLLKSGDLRITGSSFVSSFQLEKACPGAGIEQGSAGAGGTVQARGDSIVFTDSAGAVIGRASSHSDTLVVRGPLHVLTYVRQQ